MFEYALTGGLLVATLGGIDSLTVVCELPR